MTTKNPFPGMNPFSERSWRDAHTRLIAYICDDLQPRLPPDLVARAEEAVGLVTEQEEAKRYSADLRVTEPWTLKESSAAVATEPPIRADKPIRVPRDEEETERWIEILDRDGRIITAIELLSPTNKQGLGMNEYQQKRRRFMRGGTNLVEIDLVRQGKWVFSLAIRDALKEPRACYAVSVFRAADPLGDDVYPIGLRERLPVIKVPLREKDEDVVLSLQPLIDHCHEMGRYHFLDYRTDLEPPFSTEDARWVDEVLQKAGLRTVGAQRTAASGGK
jgi:hypothetical protein